MAIDRARALAMKLPTYDVQLERGRLRFFAKAIGETNPVYSDLDAARLAGHRDLPVPPTFFFSVSLEADDPFRYLTDVGIDLRHVLHGEQHFAYGAMAYAGDTLIVGEQIVDVTSKRGGAMELLTKETTFSREGEQVAVATTVIVVRNPEVTA
ncbi:MaoC family dehydratase N-terminal domain-containing protein [Actinoallomurus sp. NBC_01490]|jgi:hypothetical protein|uniref:MaoC family dehydratase N-terminal domain-containing protein n=1 Tax=Actinoallomurus sp. NBC_01490 TaxID=2903557 RepID=UPI002E3710B0|nr:MaoC family dehydratase N-terminal domain-containing protein [Actinoallomurus sp. NBC_01490]